MDILKETMEHFENAADTKKEPENKEDYWVGFKSHWVGGQQVIDLTSVDVDYTEYELHDRGADIERKQIYGDKAGSNKYL